MKISFLIPAMILYIIRESFCYDIQVGTVLFTRADLMRKCWTESDKGLLRARLIMQDVLPDPRCIDFSKPRAVSIILDYVYACFHIISTSTYGKLQNLMYLALADAVGGYLRAYVLPLTKKSYYAGLVSYEDAWKVITLYDQIRDYLKTTGAGWAEPQKVVFKNIKILPLNIPGGDPEACKILYTIEKKGKLHCINAKCNPEASKLPDLKITDTPREATNEPEIQIFKGNSHIPQPSSVPPLTTSVPFSTRGCLNGPVVKRKSPYSNNAVMEVEFPMDERNISNNAKSVKNLRELNIGSDATEEYMETNEERKIRCDCCKKKKQNCEVKTPKRIIVPLPILDDECDPHTIAVPFRKRPLRSLWKKTSAFILEHYYVAVLQCFISKGNTRSDIKNFNSQFHSWLISEVYPHLDDERWYPAFGGILRITETIKRFGAEARLNEPMSHDIAFMFRKGIGFDLPPSEEKNSKDKTRDISDFEYYDPNKSRRYLAFAVLAAAAVWSIFFCLCAYFCLGVKSKDSESGESGGSQTSASCPVSRDSNTCFPRKKSVSFQFLVRFFKKSENSDNCQHFSKINENTSKGKHLQNFNERNIIERKDSKKKLTFREKEDRNHRMTSRGDIPMHFVSNSPEKPWSCTPFLPTEKKLVRKNVENGSGESAPPWGTTKVEQPKTVQTLWKNPFLWPANKTEKGFNSKKSWFKQASQKKDTSTSEPISRNTNDSKTSTDKRSSSYSCSNGCQHSSVTTTNTTSLTNVEEKCSSATMEYFEDVTSKHKPKRKDFKQKSSTISESDTDSGTSENEY